MELRFSPGSSNAVALDDLAVSVGQEPDLNGVATLFRQIRKHLRRRRERSFSTGVQLPIDVNGRQLYLTMFQPGEAPLRWGTRNQSLSKSLDRVLSRIRSRPAFSRFAVDDPARVRLLLEWVTTRRPLPQIRLLGEDRLDGWRFEPGVTGLTFRHNGRQFYYMPTEAYTRNHMTVNQALRFLARRVGISGRNGADSVREFADQVSELEIIESKAVVSYGRRALALYRGFPMPLPDSAQAIRDSLFGSVDWLLRHQEPSGKFLYYYDPIADTEADFLHPKNPGYSNILRHCGGIITVLRAHELCADQRYVDAARLGIAYLLGKSVAYSRGGCPARYILEYKKAKLGACGVGLVALLHFYRLTGDGEFLGPAGEVVEHVLSQIAEDGELIGYYLHPHVNAGQPIESPTDEEKRELFSFYYPGEALLGLALYERYAPLSEERRAEIRREGRKALDFLIHKRPERYADLFLPLPSDAWLMQAIEEWWTHPEMRNPDYASFVYEDGAQMVRHMYNRRDALYPDYVGHFYYAYGQHPIPDGSRAEGIIAAALLARKDGKEELAEFFLNNCRIIARALMQTYNSPEAIYPAKVPSKALGAFRFKLTRQWVRVDSVQHTACFFARLLPNY